MKYSLIFSAFRKPGPRSSVDKINLEDSILYFILLMNIRKVHTLFNQFLVRTINQLSFHFTTKNNMKFPNFLFTIIVHLRSCIFPQYLLPAFFLTTLFPLLIAIFSKSSNIIFPRPSLPVSY